MPVTATREVHPRRTPFPQVIFAPRYAWLLAGVLYGFSWPAGGPNRAWLAWIALVPLFVSLLPARRFWTHAGRVLGFAAVSCVIIGWWWLTTVDPIIRPLTRIAAVWEYVLSTVPLLLLYPLRRRVGFEAALVGLIFIWPLWEWVYLALPVTTRFVVLGHSQAANVWFIQFADVVGVLGVTAWVVTLNVGAFRLLRRARWQIRAVARRPLLRRRLLGGAALLLGLPLAYGAVQYMRLSVPEAPPVRIRLVHPEFEPLEQPDRLMRMREVERTLHLADSAAYYDARPVDLVVWPEGTVRYNWQRWGTPAVLHEAVGDWNAPLLLGRVATRITPTDTFLTNRATLYTGETTYDYQKMYPFPVWETLPWPEVVQAVPPLRRLAKRRTFIHPGHDASPLLLPQKAGLAIGTPICHEQFVPSLWAEMARRGANVFIMIGNENLFGDHGVETLLMNLMRLRAIETRRPVARAVNYGRSAFYDAFGRVLATHEDVEGTLTTSLTPRTGLTIHSRWPLLFPLLCALGLVLLGRRRCCVP